MKKLQLVYFGSPDFSARFLEKMLIDRELPVEVIRVVTSLDKPVGRNHIITPSPVKQIAVKYGIPVIDDFETLCDADLCLLYSFGQLIPKEALQMPQHGFFNIHPSLLPKYRGPSPISYPLMLGDTETGVTLIKMSEELDAGPIIAQEKYTLTGKETQTDLEAALTDVGYELFKKTVSKAIPASIPQNQSLVTYTRRLAKQDGFIPLPILKKALKNEPLAIHEIPQIIQEYVNQYRISNLPGVRQGIQYQKSAPLVFNLYRGLYQWPGIWTLVKVKTLQLRLKITNSDLVGKQLIIKKVQLEGKKEVDFETFQSAYKVF